MRKDRRTNFTRYSNLVIILVLFSNAFVPAKKLYGQDTPTSHWFDSVTYQYYQQGNWLSVIRVGKEALANGYDYYYLRMRLGTAYFEQGNYRNAIRQYNQALRFNKGDDYAKKGNYYSYLNLGNREQASVIARDFGLEKKRSLGISSKNFLDFLYVETGYSPSSGQGSPAGSLIGPGKIYGEEDLQKDLFYTQLGGRIKVEPSLSLYAGFTIMNINKGNHFGYSTLIARRDSVKDVPYGKAYFYSFPRQFTDTVIPYKILQNDFYMNATFLPAQGWKITPAFHIIKVQYRKIITSYSSKTESDTAYYQAVDSTWHLFDYLKGSFNSHEKDTSFSNFIVSLSVSREIGNFSVELFGSMSDFNKMKQVQLGTSITWYPQGNTKLYGTSTVVSVFNNHTQRMVYEPSLALKISRNTWISGFATLGNLDLYNEKNAYVVYNQPDLVTFRSGMDLLILAGNHLEISLMYRFYRKEFQTLKYLSGVPAASDPLLVSVQSKQPYSNQTFIGGLKWKF